MKLYTEEFEEIEEKLYPIDIENFNEVLNCYESIGEEHIDQEESLSEYDWFKI